MDALRPIVAHLLKLPKPLLFGLCGAMGSLLTVLILGEAFLYFTRGNDQVPTTPTVEASNTIILLDTSSSMLGSSLVEAKDACTLFIKQNPPSLSSKVALITFAGQATVMAPLGTNEIALITNLKRLEAAGGTSMSEGLDLAYQQLKEAGAFNNPGAIVNSVVVFTDGEPNVKSKAIRSADKLGLAGVDLYGITTIDADKAFMATMVGSEDNVFEAASGNFSGAFDQVSKRIQSRHLLDSQGASDFKASMIQASGWSGLLAVGIVVSLLMGQQFYLGKTETDYDKLTKGLLFGFGAGVLCGLIGQGLYYYITSRTEIAYYALHLSLILIVLYAFYLLWRNLKREPWERRHLALLLIGVALSVLAHWRYFQTGGYYLIPILCAVAVVILLFTSKDKGNAGAALLGLIIGFVSLWLVHAFVSGHYIEWLLRLISWTILGASIGAILCLFVPNLQWKKSTLAGAIGGLVGAIAFIYLSSVLGDTMGRLSGAFVIGFGISSMVAVAEKASALAWLKIKTQTAAHAPSIALSHKPLSVGSLSTCDIQIDGLTYDKTPREYGEIFVTQDGVPRLRLNPEFREQMNLSETEFDLDDPRFVSIFRNSIKAQQANTSGFQVI